MGLADRPISSDHLHSIRPVCLSSGQLACPNAQLGPQPLHLAGLPLHLAGLRLLLHPQSLQTRKLVLYPTNQQLHYMFARHGRYPSRDHRRQRGHRRQRWRSHRRWGQGMTQRNHQRGQGGRDVIRHRGCWRGRGHREQGRHFKRRKGVCRRSADRWRGLGRRRARRSWLAQKLCHPRMTPPEPSPILGLKVLPFPAERSLHRGHRFLNIGEAPLPTPSHRSRRSVAIVRAGAQLLL
jgi:hypothetical protein